MLFIDVETSGLNPRLDKLHGLGVLDTETGESGYFTLPLPSHIAAKLQNPQVVKVGHNVGFDLKFLSLNGYKIGGVWEDSRIMAHLLDENNSTGLKELVSKHFGDEFLVDKRELDRVLREADCTHVGQLCAKDLADERRPYTAVIGKYCLEDIRNTKQLFDLLSKKLEELHVKIKARWPYQKTPKDIYHDECMPFERVRVAMELAGLDVDLTKIETARTELLAEQAGVVQKLEPLIAPHKPSIEAHFSQRTLEKKLEKLKTEPGKERLRAETHRWHEPFSWTKPQHVLRLLSTELAVPKDLFLKTDKGQLALHEESVSNMQEKLPHSHPAQTVLTQYTEYKRVAKLLNTYVGTEPGEGISKDLIGGKVFPQYTPYIVTGRLGCSEPNVQNLPRNTSIRGFFVPPPGHVFLHFDASQVELRIAAHLSGDPELVDAYNEGRDLHRQTASSMYGVVQELVDAEQRQDGKTLNFLLIFDGSPRRIQSEFKVKLGKEFSEEECRAFKEAFFARYAVYKAYLQSQLEKMQRTKVVFTETGRMRRLPDLVYGEYINYRRQEFKGPKMLYAELVKEAAIRKLEPTDKVIFELASKKFSHAKKQGYNLPVQGLGASIMKRGAIALRKAGYRVACTVHDSFDVPVAIKNYIDDMKKIETILNNCYTLKIPLVWEGKVLTSLNEKDLFEPEKKP